MFSAAWLIVAARYLSVTAFGDLATLVSVGTILMTLADLGLPFLLADAVARSGDVSWRTILHVGYRRLAAGAAMAVVAGVAYAIVASDRRPIVPLLFGLSLLATAFHSTMTAAMRGLGRFNIEATNDVISRFGVLVAGVAVLAGGGGLVGSVAAYAAGDLVSVLAVALVVNRHVVEDDGIDLSRLTTRKNAPMAAGRFLSTLYYRVDLWLLALLKGSDAAGAYGAPYRFLDGLLLVPRAMGAVAITHAGRRHREGLPPRSPGTIALGAAAAVAVIVVPCMIFAGPLVRLTFGARYADSAGVLAVLMASAVPGAIVAVLVPLAAVGNGRRFATIVGGALLANVALNVLMIPRYGVAAAAWNTLVCQSALAVLLSREFRGQPESTAPSTPAVDLVGGR